MCCNLCGRQRGSGQFRVRSVDGSAGAARRVRRCRLVGGTKACHPQRRGISESATEVGGRGPVPRRSVSASMIMTGSRDVIRKPSRGKAPTTPSPTRTPSTRRSSGLAARRPAPGALLKAVRGLLHRAMALYLARYLNVPPASPPGEGDDRLDDLPVAAEEIGAALLDTFDRQQQIGAAARLVARHLILRHSPDALIATLAQALLREDAGFHAYQMLEAGVRQFGEWATARKAGIF
jgi:hypothetical protein